MMAELPGPHTWLVILEDGTPAAAADLDSRGMKRGEVLGALRALVQAMEARPGGEA